MPFKSRFASDANREALGTLRWILSRAEEGFFIFTADSPDLQRAVARELEAENPQNTAIFDYAATVERAYSYRTLARWAQDHPQGVYIVVNLQLALGEERDIYNLNLSRDMLSGHKKIWLFGMTRETDDRLTRSAVDFYSFVRVKESFADENPEPRTPVIEPALSYSGFASAAQAREFIRAYKSMENEYMKLDVSANAAREALLSAATTLTNLAEAYGFIADYDKAMGLCLKVLEIREKVLGKEHYDTASTYNNIAVVYTNQGNYAKALKLYKKALMICEKALGLEHPNTATSCNNIAAVYRNQGDYPKALEWHKKALTIREKVLGIEHPDTADSYNSIALVYSDHGDYAKALKWHKKALAIREKVLGADYPETARSYNNIAAVYHAQGDYAKALEWYEKSYRIALIKLGAEHPTTVQIKKNMQAACDSAGVDMPSSL